jgi:hypothetical protein
MKEWIRRGFAAVQKDSIKLGTDKRVREWMQDYCIKTQEFNNPQTGEYSWERVIDDKCASDKKLTNIQFMPTVMKVTTTTTAVSNNNKSAASNMNRSRIVDFSFQNQKKKKCDLGCNCSTCRYNREIVRLGAKANLNALKERVFYEQQEQERKAAELEKTKKLLGLFERK